MVNLDDFYGDWSVGLGIEVIEADGTPMRWSEFVNARKRLVLALASDPIEGTGL